MVIPLPPGSSPLFTDSRNFLYTDDIENIDFLLLHLSVAVGTCLPGGCPETALIYPPISRLLHSNGSALYSISNFIQFYSVLSEPISFFTKVKKIKLTLGFNDYAPSHEDM
jgi:hypothetical protein